MFCTIKFLYFSSVFHNVYFSFSLGISVAHSLILSASFKSHLWHNLLQWYKQLCPSLINSSKIKNMKTFNFGNLSCASRQHEKIQFFDLTKTEWFCGTVHCWCRLPLCVKLHFGAYCDGGNFWLSGEHTYTQTHTHLYTPLHTYTHTPMHTQYFTQYAQYTSSHKLKSEQGIEKEEEDGNATGIGGVALYCCAAVSCAL